MAKNTWGTPDKDSNPWAAPKKKTSNQKPPEFRKATYDKTSIFGKSVHAEGRSAGKVSKEEEKKRR